MTSRERLILNLIVSDYIREATPVASEMIARRHDLGVSSATIRNDVVELEQGGFIMRPHVSAGSIPLGKAYRMYVESLQVAHLTAATPEMITHIRNRLSEVERVIDEWSNVAAAILAGLVGNLAIVTLPRSREARIRHVELVGLQDILALLVLVLDQAKVRRQLVKLSKPTDPETLHTLANKLNHQFAGLSSREIRAVEGELSDVESEVIDATVEVLQEEDRVRNRDYILVGLRNLLNQPEFEDKDIIAGIVEHIEDGALAQAVLSDAFESGGVVRVVIGHEHKDEMLRPFSVVLGQYGVPGEATGVIGAIGPMRMEYPKTIASVELMVRLMSDLAQGVSSR